MALRIRTGSAHQNWGPANQNRPKAPVSKLRPRAKPIGRFPLPPAPKYRIPLPPRQWPGGLARGLLGRLPINQALDAFMWANGQWEGGGAISGVDIFPPLPGVAVHRCIQRGPVATPRYGNGCEHLRVSWVHGYQPPCSVGPLTPIYNEGVSYTPKVNALGYGGLEVTLGYSVNANCARMTSHHQENWSWDKSAAADGIPRTITGRQLPVPRFEPAPPLPEPDPPPQHQPDRVPQPRLRRVPRRHEVPAVRVRGDGRLAPDIHVRQRPLKRDKENKRWLLNSGAAKKIGDILGHIGEVKEMADAIAKGLPDNLRYGYRWQKGLHNKIKYLIKHEGEIDITIAAKEVWGNQGEDRAIGNVQRGLRDALRGSPYWRSPRLPGVSRMSGRIG